MTVLLMLLGAGIGGGICLLVWGLSKTDAPATQPRLARLYPDFRVRLALATVAALVALAVTRWPVAVIAAFALGFFFRDILGDKRRQTTGVEKSLAIASWTEMLRDTLAASSGLEEAIAVTAPLASPNIQPALAGLVSRFGRVTLASALASFADEVADPTADLVISALILGAQGEAQHLADLLSALAVSARDDANMRSRINAARAGTRTSVRVVATVTIAGAGGLLLLNGSYLQPYGTVSGQIVLAVVFAIFAAGLFWLNLMSRFKAPERFLAPKEQTR